MVSRSNGHDRVKSKIYDRDETRGSYITNILQHTDNIGLFNQLRPQGCGRGGVNYSVSRLWQVATSHSSQQCLTLFLRIKKSVIMLLRFAMYICISRIAC